MLSFNRWCHLGFESSTIDRFDVCHFLTFQRKKCAADRTKPNECSVIYDSLKRITSENVESKCIFFNTIANRNVDFYYSFLFHLQLLSKFLSAGYVPIRRNENLLRQCRLFSQTTTEAPAQSSETNCPTEAEDDKLYKRLELELRGVDPTVLNSFTTFAATAAKHLNIEVGRW